MKTPFILKHLRTIFLVVFSFILGCMITNNLTPIDRTCRIDNTDREYNIMKNSKFKNPDLVILILSAPKNIENRNTIRETWLKLIDENPDNEKKFKYKHYFVIGSLGLHSNDVIHLSSEQSRYNDILILPMHDSYQNLTLKVQKSFEWLNEQYDYGLGFTYVLKCDDDSFVNVEKLVQEIPNMKSILFKSNLQYSLNLSPEKLNSFITTNVQSNHRNANVETLDWYWGYFSGAARVKNSGKWKENAWIACDRYVPYALGGGYILTKNLVTFIAKNANHLRSFKSEDVSVGFWLAPVNNVIRIHDIRFDTEWTSRGCKDTHLITHNIQMEDMRKMYEYLVGNKRLCEQEKNKRDFYLYNWELPPSQCCKHVKEQLVPIEKVQ